MAITVPLEGKIWQLAPATLGVESLAHLVAELLASYVKTRPVDVLGYLRSEWLGAAALQALLFGCKGAPVVRRKSRRSRVA